MSTSLACVLASLVLTLLPAGVRAEESAGRLAFVSELASTAREHQAWVSQQARTIPADNAFLDLKGFCDKFSASEAMGIWKHVDAAARRHLPRGRESLIEGLAALVKKCGNGGQAALRAAFLLDYLYWNRLADLTGLEVADALAARDRFYELYHLATSSKIQRRNELALAASAAADGACVLEKDYFNTGPISGAGALRAFGKLVNAFDGRGRQVIDAVTDTLDLHAGSSALLYGRDILEILDDPADLAAMNGIHEYLAELRAHPRLLGERHGGWKRILKICGGDRTRVVRLLGVLASMRYWPLDQIGAGLARRGKLSEEKLRALYQGSMAYFYLNQLDERSALDGRDESSLEYHFFYPPGYSTSNWKIYHYYGNAHLGCELVKKGFSVKEARYGASRLALAYEAATLNLAGPSKLAIDVDPRVEPILEGYDDVGINTEGAEFGAKLCLAKKSAGR